jgi:hypothetical protein
MFSRGDKFMQKIEKFLIQVEKKPEAVTLIIHRKNGDNITMTLQDLIDLYDPQENGNSRQSTLDEHEGYKECVDDIKRFFKKKTR